MTDFGTKLLKVHGILLMIVGLSMAVQTIMGGLIGVGMMKFIHGNTFSLIGLFEAYLLAATLGVFLFFLSKESENKIWHLLAALVHVVLLTVNLIFWDAYALGKIQLAGYISTMAHVILIMLELTAFSQNLIK